MSESVRIMLIIPVLLASKNLVWLVAFFCNSTRNDIVDTSDKLFDRFVSLLALPENRSQANLS